MTPPTAAAAFDALLTRQGGDLILLVDDRLRIVRAGAGAANLAERPEAGLRGMSMIAAFGSASLDAVARQALTTGEAVSGEADLGRLGGRQFAVDAVPLPDGGLVLSLQDISALRRIERVRRDFVANISHELRTPLSSIKLLAETVASGSVEDVGTIRDFAAQIERETDHLAQLVDELLDLSMIESGETRLAVDAVDPEVVVTECIARIRALAERRDVSVARASEVVEPGVRVRADASRLGQALLNLAHNAVKFSHPGGLVRIGWSATAPAVRFSVSDDGIGVPDVHQARIFERFYKVDRSRARGPEPEPFGGSAGLGLAIVRHIAEAHHGTAGVDSTEGIGSTFWIELPRA